MFIKIYGFTVLNLKILIAEKIAFLWSVALPVVIALVYQNDITSALAHDGHKQWYLGWYWTYVIVAAFVNGIGLQLARMREYGLLKSYILIAGGKSPFIIATFVTQLIFCSLSLTLFNVIVGLYFNAFSFTMLLHSFLLMLCSLPFGLFTLVLTILPIKISNLGTIINIVLYPLFIMAMNAYHSDWNLLNPFGWINQMIFTLDGGGISLVFMGVSILYLAIGVFSYIKMNLISYVQR